MDEVSMIGLDTSKSVFEVHGTNSRGEEKLKRSLKRSAVIGFFEKLPKCTVALEACGCSHQWGRELMALGFKVLLVPPPFVKRFLNGRRKTDARDAKALALAGLSAELRAVPVKGVAAQACGLSLKVRDLLVRQSTQTGNSLRGLLAEFGHVAAKGDAGLAGLIARLEAGELAVPAIALEAFAVLVKQWHRLGAEIAALSKAIVARAKADPVISRLMAVPGVGPLTATAFVLKVADPKRFDSARQCSAWLGMAPNEHSTAGKRRLGRITKEGDEGVRRLLVLGAATVLIRARRSPQTARPWVRGILQRRPFKVAAVALAARNARTLWALLARGTDYMPAKGHPVKEITA